MKFGGTSVGSPERIRNVAELIAASGKGNVIVLSAMSGTTNTLVEIAGYLYNHNADGAKDTIGRLEAKYRKVIEELYSTDEYREKANEYVGEIFHYLGTFYKQLFTSKEEKIILAQGELISTYLMTCYLQEKGVNVALIPALEYMKIDMLGEPDQDYIKEHFGAEIGQ